MISIGHRTGLFDGMADLPPSTVEQIAAHTGLECRYVKEWLSAMVVGGIVQYQADDAQYLLPKTHAALLTRLSSPDNIAVFAQYISVLGQVEDQIVDCFRLGGGVSYAHFPRFHEVMSEDSGQTVLAALDGHILPLVADIMPKLKQGIRVLRNAEVISAVDDFIDNRPGNSKSESDLGRCDPVDHRLNKS